MTQRYPTKAERDALADSLPTDRLWTESEAAAFWRKHPITMANWRRDGKGPPFIQPEEGDGRMVLYDPAAQREYAARNTHNPITPTAARPAEGQRRGAN